MSTYRSVVISCRMRSIGNSGARSSGPTGCRVPGCSGGGGGLGRSGTTLYHCVGSWGSSSWILYCAPDMGAPPPRRCRQIRPMAPCGVPPRACERWGAGGPISVGVEGGVELAPGALARDHLERAADTVAAEQQPVAPGELQRLD